MQRTAIGGRGPSTVGVIMGVGEVVSLIVGFVLGHTPAWFDRHRRMKTHWHSLRAEALLCKKTAEGFLAADFMSPLYRLPVVAFERAFPILEASDGR